MTLDFQSMWTRCSSDVASQVSSDGSSYLDPSTQLEEPFDDFDEDEVVKFRAKQYPQRGREEVSLSSTVDDTATYESFSPSSVLDISNESMEDSSPQPVLLNNRRQRRKKLHSAAKRDQTMCFDDWQIECLGGSAHLDQAEDTDPVDVVVEATAICDLDLIMQPSSGMNFDCQSMMDNQELLPGTNFVGILHKGNSTTNRRGLRVGSRVAALVPSGANSRYIQVQARYLHAVPHNLDSAEVCAVLSSFLPAFAKLNHGRSTPQRYSRTCLKERTVLIVGCMSLEAQAAVRLAQLAGAREIYVTAPSEYAHILTKHGPHILREDPKDWLPHVEGDMDLILDYTFPKNFVAVQKALAPEGRLVCSESRSRLENPQCLFPLEHFVEYCYLATLQRASLFAFENEIEDYETIHEDLAYLFEQMKGRKIRPDIEKYISLSELPQAHNDLMSSPLTGSIICEPWKE